jgi:hypothetical protein
METNSIEAPELAFDSTYRLNQFPANSPHPEPSLRAA